MPKFLYTVLVLNAALWWYTIHWINTTKPATLTNILTFLFLLFVSLGITLSVLFYFRLYKKAPSFTNLRLLYRRGLKWGFFSSFGIVFVLGMKALNIYHIINLLLFAVFYYALYLQLRSKR